MMAALVLSTQSALSAKTATIVALATLAVTRSAPSSIVGEAFKILGATGTATMVALALNIQYVASEKTALTVALALRVIGGN